MVQSIARYAVIRKTRKDVNILTGNYEAAYAIGILSNILQTLPDMELKSVTKLRQQLLEKLEGYQPGNQQEDVLIQMLREYKPSDQWDEDVEAMLKWGLEENRIWEL
ncbi:Domain of uncharacterised function (DUF3837) [uncultured Roseburia sp.]|uniref:DUF3837 domain-containing protein n=1 Tax=Brotonthovivens ammoniilytica TaxID=2981725 RepID=A0ABT2TJV3_9FIRM|nr:DUF3837 family protein [Brotonthovivens ammoniilytica]MCU6761804.1 DUF3837 domain-containing protein [Brotonthovivens ammoniilytica]SCI47193.1 Domain of uncharacterised function (DUF3837) [uncultured Roseburia sp.]